MLRITGYSDKYSVCPGDEITFYVNSEKNESYKADIVRLIHGDTNPEGPGFKEKVIKHLVIKIIKVKIKKFMVALMDAFKLIIEWIQIASPCKPSYFQRRRTKVDKV